MKLKYGLTHVKKHRTDIKKLTEWQDHFCILPRMVGHKDCRWLETIQRKGELVEVHRSIQGMAYYAMEWEFEYKAKDG